MNNYLYDIARITIAADNVESTFTHKPHRWDMNLIRNFMFSIGPSNSVYDSLTFYILLGVSRSDERFFMRAGSRLIARHAGLVVLLIRAAGNLLKSPPSGALIVTVSAVVVIWITLPFSPLAEVVGFVPLSSGFFFFC